MVRDNLDRLTLLERAQLLHDSTMRRYGEHLDHHAERMDALQRTQDTLVAAQTALHELVTQHDDRMNALHQLIAQHDDRMAELRQILAAIKDLLERRNGH